MVCDYKFRNPMVKMIYITTISRLGFVLLSRGLGSKAFQSSSRNQRLGVLVGSLSLAISTGRRIMASESCGLVMSGARSF
jgi:hypothetical protein